MSKVKDKSRKVFAKMVVAVVAVFAISLGMWLNFAPGNELTTHAVDGECIQELENNFVLNTTSQDTTITSAKIANPDAGPVTVNGTSYNLTNGMAEIPSADAYAAFGSDGVATGMYNFFATSLTLSDKIVVKYNNTASYGGVAVDAIVTYSDFIVGNVGAANQFQIAKRLIAGVRVVNATDARYEVDIKFVKSGTNEVVPIANDAYFAVLSLNPDEYTAPISGIAHTGMTADTFIVTRNVMGIDAYTSGTASGPTTWTDAMGGQGFSRAAVSYRLSGSEFSFYLGLDRTTVGSPWTSFASVMFDNTISSACPARPTKAVDKTLLTVSNTAQDLTYTISQKTQSLATEILVRYRKFVISDEMDPRISVDPAKVTVTVGGKNRTGDFAIDFSGRTLTISASSNLLQDNAFYGQDVVATIPVRALAKDAGTLADVASVNIDDRTQATNSVTTNLIAKVVSPTPILPTKAPVVQKPPVTQKPGAPGSSMASAVSISASAILILGAVTAFSVRRLTAKKAEKAQK